jgi:hypothetical protein
MKPSSLSSLKNEPHNFNAAERAVYIRKMVACITKYMEENRSVEEIKSLLPEFHEQYKNLFEMITAPEGYDKNNLQIMLNMLDHMNTGSLSQHDASVIVGKRLYEKYGKKE